MRSRRRSPPPTSTPMAGTRRRAASGRGGGGVWGEGGGGERAVWPQSTDNAAAHAADVDEAAVDGGGESRGVEVEQKQLNRAATARWRSDGGTGGPARVCPGPRLPAQ
eukprot:4753147-Pleurochrysis_carterae.AAC.1